MNCDLLASQSIRVQLARSATSMSTPVTGAALSTPAPPRDALRVKLAASPDPLMVAPLRSNVALQFHFMGRGFVERAVAGSGHLGSEAGHGSWHPSAPTAAPTCDDSSCSPEDVGGGGAGIAGRGVSISELGYDTGRSGGGAPRNTLPSRSLKRLRSSPAPRRPDPEGSDLEGSDLDDFDLEVIGEDAAGPRSADFVFASMCTSVKGRCEFSLRGVSLSLGGQHWVANSVLVALEDQ